MRHFRHCNENLAYMVRQRPSKRSMPHRYQIRNREPFWRTILAHCPGNWNQNHLYYENSLLFDQSENPSDEKYGPPFIKCHTTARSA